VGKNDREARSPSFFNIDEIAIVRSYVERLRKFKKVVTCEFWKLVSFFFFCFFDNLAC